jgi:hypothetical protein
MVTASGELTPNPSLCVERGAGDGQMTPEPMPRRPACTWTTLSRIRAARVARSSEKAVGVLVIDMMVLAFMEVTGARQR